MCAINKTTSRIYSVDETLIKVLQAASAISGTLCVNIVCQLPFLN